MNNSGLKLQRRRLKSNQGTVGLQFLRAVCPLHSLLKYPSHIQNFICTNCLKVTLETHKLYRKVKFNNLCMLTFELRKILTCALMSYDIS